MMRAVVFLLLAGSAEASAATSENVVGTWKYEESGLVGSGIMFTVLKADRSCAQVARAKVFGATKWAVIECTWTLEEESLRLSIVKSTSQPDSAGKTVTFKVVEADQSHLLLLSGKEQQKWTRAESLPADYEQVLKESR
jgi:hypothetical protein